MTFQGIVLVCFYSADGGIRMDQRPASALKGVLLPLALLAVGATAEPQPRVLREFKNVALIELSADGHWILAASFRRVDCSDTRSACNSEVLTVYDTASGKPVGELISPKSPPYGIPNRFLTPSFVEHGKVRTIESTWDGQRKDLNFVLVIWDPISRSEQRRPIEFPKSFDYQCPVDDGHLLGLGPQEIRPPYVSIERNGQKYFDMGDPANRVPHQASRPLQVMAPGGPAETIAVIADTPFPLNGGFRCKAWRLGTSYLIENAVSGDSLEDRHFGKSLAWFSTEPGTASRPCRAFEGQRIHGYALSPDGTRVAVITSPLNEARYRPFLIVLDAGNCAEVGRFELQFPEQPRQRAPLLAPSRKYFDNVPFPDQFARMIAISPDNKLLAVAYGIIRGRSGSAFVGVYSISDGHRMTTLKGDTFTPSLYETVMLDIYRAREAPIDGAIQFAPDSQSLYTSSWSVRQWDVSKLR